MDNEASADLKSAMETATYTYQLVPPENHRKNAAERAIQTWKTHFLAGLASLPGDFPLSEWDRLVLQGQITLLLLRSARSNPNLSAYAYLYGNFDFNKTPLASPGTKVMVHYKPIQRATWDPNGKLGWYIGPSMQHYQYMKFYMPITKSKLDKDTVTFIPHNSNS